jgi:DNA transposition AAA+ family ATPase
MKKKKDAKKQDMPEFAFKQFTPDENRIYEEAISRFRSVLEAGKSLREAYESYSIEDKDLENLIRADFLKIVIAERHFGKGQTLEDLAGALGVPLELVQDTKNRMLQEAGVTAASQFGQEFVGLGNSTDD